MKIARRSNQPWKQRVLTFMEMAQKGVCVLHVHGGCVCVSQVVVLPQWSIRSFCGDLRGWNLYVCVCVLAAGSSIVASTSAHSRFPQIPT